MIATQTLPVPRDSYGKELTPQQSAAREQKIQSLMTGGRDRWSAENLADGRPEWSQRVDCSNNVTQSPVYLASKAINDAGPKPDRETLSDLQERLDKIQFQIGEYRRKKETAAHKGALSAFVRFSDIPTLCARKSGFCAEDGDRQHTHED